MLLHPSSQINYHHMFKKIKRTQKKERPSPFLYIYFDTRQFHSFSPTHCCTTYSSRRAPHEATTPMKYTKKAPCRCVKVSTPVSSLSEEDCRVFSVRRDETFMTSSDFHLLMRPASTIRNKLQVRTFRGPCSWYSLH